MILARRLAKSSWKWPVRETYGQLWLGIVRPVLTTYYNKKKVWNRKISQDCDINQEYKSCMVQYNSDKKGVTSWEGKV